MAERNRDEYRSWRTHPYTQLVLDRIKELRQDKETQILHLAGRPSDELVRVYNQILGGILALEDAEELFSGDTDV